MGLKQTLQRASQAGAEQKDGQFAEQLAHARTKLSILSKQIRAYQEGAGALQELCAGVGEAVRASEPYPRTGWRHPKASESSVAPVIKISDWQIGEIINPKETEDFGSFNWAIAQERVFLLGTKVLAWTAMHRRAGFAINDLHIFSEADHVSGNIHYELEVTNEFPLPVATANAGLLLGEFIARLAPHFKRVVVHEMSADNHGRLTHKNQAKQGAMNNMSWLVHVIANSYLKRHDNVEIDSGAGTKLLVEVEKHRFLLQHGHSVKAWMGIPYYGLERERAREANRRMLTGKEFHYISCGHWHVFGWVGQNILINGNLPGTTEFDHMSGRHAPPAQVSFMVHPKHGVFNFTPWLFPIIGGQRGQR